jgi:hypothetical protein
MLTGGVGQRSRGAGRGEGGHGEPVEFDGLFLLRLDGTPSLEQQIAMPRGGLVALAPLERTPGHLLRGQLGYGARHQVFAQRGWPGTGSAVLDVPAGMTPLQWPRYDLATKALTKALKQHGRVYYALEPLDYLFIRKRLSGARFTWAAARGGGSGGLAKSRFRGVFLSAEGEWTALIVITIKNTATEIYLGG